MEQILAAIVRRDPEQREFHQVIREFFATIRPVLERHPEYRQPGGSGADGRTGADDPVPRSLDGRSGQWSMSTAATGWR